MNQRHQYWLTTSMIPFTSNLVDVVYFSKSQTQGITNHAKISGK